MILSGGNYKMKNLDEFIEKSTNFKVVNNYESRGYSSWKGSYITANMKNEYLNSFIISD